MDSLKQQQKSTIKQKSLDHIILKKRQETNEIELRIQKRRVPFLLSSIKSEMYFSDFYFLPVTRPGITLIRRLGLYGLISESNKIYHMKERAIN